MAKRLQVTLNCRSRQERLTLPPIGPALGQRGLNIMEFCKAFNAATQQGYEPGTPVPVIITAYGDRTFTFITKTPPVSYYLKKFAGVAKGSKTPGKGDTVGKITWINCAKSRS